MLILKSIFSFLLVLPLQNDIIKLSKWQETIYNIAQNKAHIYWKHQSVESAAPRNLSTWRAFLLFSKANVARAADSTLKKIIATFRWKLINDETILDEINPPGASSLYLSVSIPAPVDLLRLSTVLIWKKKLVFYRTSSKSNNSRQRIFKVFFIVHWAESAFNYSNKRWFGASDSQDSFTLSRHFFCK